MLTGKEKLKIGSPPAFGYAPRINVADL